MLDNSEQEKQGIDFPSRGRSEEGAQPQLLGEGNHFQFNLLQYAWWGERLPVTVVVRWSIPRSVNSAETLHPKEPTHPYQSGLLF